MGFMVGFLVGVVAVIIGALAFGLIDDRENDVPDKYEPREREPVERQTVEQLRKQARGSHFGRHP